MVKKPSLGTALKNDDSNYILVGDMVYQKKAKYNPKPYIVIDNQIVNSKEYSVSYSAAGTLSGPEADIIATVTAKDSKNYAGSVNVSYNVVEGTDKTDVNKAKVQLSKSGKKKVHGGVGDKVTLIPGVDYTIKIGRVSINNGEEILSNFDIYYANNDAPGKATIILKGKGDYVGVFSANFTIKKAEMQ
jgi:hypothetical protein